MRSLVAIKYSDRISRVCVARDFKSTKSILKIAPHGIWTSRVVTTRAVRGISPSIFSSFHSVPLKFAETGLSSFASRNGFAANAPAASKIDGIRKSARATGIFMSEILAADRLTLHLRNSQSESYEDTAGSLLDRS